MSNQELGNGVNEKDGPVTHPRIFFLANVNET